MIACPHCGQPISEADSMADECPHCREPLSLPPIIVATEHESTVDYPAKGDATQPYVAPTTEQPTRLAPDAATQDWGAGLQTDGLISVNPHGGVSAAQGSLVIKSRSLNPDRAAAKGDADYELLEVIGEGGMGVVYAARQTSIDRVVALKMPKQSGGVEEQNKFLAEAVITGDLDHPNIVPIHELGTNDGGMLFYSMKRVLGTPWKVKISSQPVADALEILLSVADAVAFAHANGVVHRDLKPDNVMLGEFGEVMVMDWGLAMTTADFRHAAVIHGTAGHGGTPAYMAPEMANRDLENIGPLSDVYLLGAILYEIVTGAPPHPGHNALERIDAAAQNIIRPTDKSGELLEIALRAMATRPTDRYPGVKAFQEAIRQYQRHLESITLRSRADAELETARQLSDQNDPHDYERFARALYGYQEASSLWSANVKAREGLAETQLAYGQSALRKGDFEFGLTLLNPDDAAHAGLWQELKSSQQQRSKKLRLQRALKRAIAGLLLVIVGLSTGAALWINRERNRAEHARENAVQSAAEAQRQRTAAESAREQAVSAQEVAISERNKAKEAEDVAVLERQKAETSAEQARNERQKALEAEREARAAEVAATQQRDKAAYAAYIATIGHVAAKVEENDFDTARALLEQQRTAVAQGTPLRNWEWGRLKFLCHRDRITLDLDALTDTVSYSPDGQHIATGGRNGQIRIWNAKSGTLLGEPLQLPAPVHALAFSTDGRWLASGDARGVLSVRRADTGDLAVEWPAHEKGILGINFSTSGDQVLTCSYDHTAKCWNWDGQRWQLQQTFADHSWWVWSAVFSPNADSLVTTGQDGRAIVWSRPSTPDSKSNANRDEGDGVSHSRTDYRKQGEFLHHDAAVYAASFSPDGIRIATAGGDQRIRVWPWKSLTPVNLARRLEGEREATVPHQVLTGHTAPVRSLQFSPDGRWLASGSQDNTVKIWEREDSTQFQSAPRRTLQGHSGQVTAVAFAPDGRHVVSASHDRTARVWDIDAYHQNQSLGANVVGQHQDSILSARFSPKGEAVVTASRDRTAALWDVASRQLLRRYREGHEFLATAARFSDDGQFLFTSAGDETTRRWNVQTGTEDWSVTGTGSWGAICLLGDGSQLASGSSTGPKLMIWDARTGEPWQELEGHQAAVSAIGQARDGRLVSGDERGGGLVWQRDPTTQRWSLERELVAHSRTITAIQPLATTHRVVTASRDTTAVVWDLNTGEQLATLPHPRAVHDVGTPQKADEILTACDDGVMRHWRWDQSPMLRLQTVVVEPIANTDSSNGSPIQPAATTGRSFTLSVSSDLRQIITASPADGKVRQWQRAPGPTDTSELPWTTDRKQPLFDYAQLGGILWSARFAADDVQLVTIGGNDARIWNLDTRREVMRLSPHGAVASATISPDGTRLVTASWDRSAKIWDQDSGAPLLRLFGGHQGAINSAIYSPDGQQILTASDDGSALLWDAATGQQTAVRLIGHQAAIRQAAFMADGSRIVTASADRTARIWDAATGEELARLSHPSRLLTVAISRDGHAIITGGDDHSATIWDVANGQARARLAGHTAPVAAVAFSNDGQRAVTGSHDHLVKIWDTVTGQELLTLRGHQQEVTAVEFSPNGRDILTSSRDGTAIVWPANDWESDGAERQ